MKNKKVFLIILLAFVLVLAGAYVLYDRFGQELAPEQMIIHSSEPTAAPAETETTPEPEADESDDTEEEARVIYAPDFTVYDIDGNAVNLSDHFGKPIVLNFWASWCGPCKSEMPDFDAKYAELGDEINFVMVNMTDGSRETVDIASGFISESGYSFPVLYDTASDAAMTYGVYSLPTSFFINAEGHVIAQATGAISADILQKGIDMITE